MENQFQELEKSPCKPGDGKLTIRYTWIEYNHDIYIPESIRNRFPWILDHDRVSFQVVPYGENSRGLAIIEPADPKKFFNYALSWCGVTPRVRLNRIFNSLLIGIKEGVYDVEPIKFKGSDTEYPLILFGKQ